MPEQTPQQPAGGSASASPTRAERLPRMPAWADDIRTAYQASASVQFLIHGEVDLARIGRQWVPIREFLYRAFCGGKRVIYYNIGEGITFPTKDDERQFSQFADVYCRAGAERPRRPSDPRDAMPMIEEWLVTRSNAVAILDFAEKIAPNKPAAFASVDEKRTVIALRRWAVDPRILAKNNCVFLVTDTLSEINPELYQSSSRVHLVSVPLPDEDERLEYIQYLLELPEAEFPRDPVREAVAPLPLSLDMAPEVLAKITNGLSRIRIADCLRYARAAREKVSHELVTRWKKRSIEAELGELVEFLEPRHGLEALAGMDRQKELLLRVARAMREGKREIVPKGIMLLGPPGCGKTFSMHCFAHDCGIPFLTVKNIFSKYVGATEANLEKLFHYLEALSPVFVFMDEFDQTYGRRVTSDSDSGVSRRVFAMFNSFLSDDAHQGRILFGAATNRPDLLDAATLRAGRFDLKLPYFLPDDATRRSVFEVTFRTLGVRHEIQSLDEAVRRTAGYSGADLRELVLVAHRNAGLEGRDVVAQEDLDFAVEDYIPPGRADPDAVRFMELLAVALTTSRSLLSPEHTRLVDSGKLQAELDELRFRIEARGG